MITVLAVLSGALVLGLVAALLAVRRLAGAVHRLRVTNAALTRLGDSAPDQ